MKKTATVTWITYRNLGTCLQAYALQKAIQALGHENAVIDDARIVRSVPRKRFSLLRMLRSIPWLCPKRTEFTRRIADVESEIARFKSLMMNVDSSWTDLDELGRKYDAFIAGSDQIWSPYVPFNPYYYLSFTSAPKIAYAPSFGSESYPEAMVSAVKPLLQSFSHLSVREKAGQSILKERFGLDSRLVCDPTMLLGVEEWDRISRKIQVFRPYVLLYLLTYNASYVDCVRQYCRKMNLELKVVVTNHDMIGVGDDLYCGPREFLSYVKAASICFTDSFHGTIFSLLFQKEFVTFKRFRPGSAGSQNSRVENLLCELGLESRLLSEESLSGASSGCFPQVDYSQVNVKIARLREESLQYLERSLR